MELLLIPQLARFAEKHKLKMVLSKEQNFYPDISFVDKDNNRFALDLKTTYRIDDDRVNGMTLGAFTGYFRHRESTKNITFPYSTYRAHVVLGVIYSRQEPDVQASRKYTLEELHNIVSVARDFKFFVQEKYRIAADRPGSGNTKNIGSVVEIEKLVNGKGPFASLGEEVFDDYWMFYMTSDKAQAAELKSPPYTNLKGYLAFRHGRKRRK